LPKVHVIEHRYRAGVIDRRSNCVPRMSCHHHSSGYLWRARQSNSPGDRINRTNSSRLADAAYAAAATASCAVTVAADATDGIASTDAICALAILAIR
jgi:hypothetical protein